MASQDSVSRAETFWTWVTAVLTAFAALVLFHCHADFPYLYHTDEPSKVSQIIERDYNFHHPLLLMRTTETLIGVTGTPLTPQAVVEKGRLASAIFAALAVGATVLLAGQLAGRIAGTAAGILAMTHPVLFELSHYMKEDCALLAGVMGTLAALVYYIGQPSLRRAAVIGLFAGLAISGKYCGGLVALFALGVVAWIRGPGIRNWAAVGIAAACLVVTFAFINYPAIQNIGRAKSGLQQEMEKIEKRAEERDSGIHFKHLSKLGTSVSVPVLLGMAYWGRRRWRLRRHESLPIRALGVFLLGYFLLISLAPKTKDRYLLPVYISAAALGAAGFGEWRRRHRRDREAYSRLAAHFVALAALGLNMPGFLGEYSAFATDDRRELAEYIRKHVPPTAGVAFDVCVMLRRANDAGLPGFSLPNPLYEPPDRYVADLGSIEELKRRGITHVVVCEPDFHNTAMKGDDPQMRARNRWYADLFDYNRLAWKAKPGPVAYLQPGLRLYELK